MGRYKFLPLIAVVFVSLVFQPLTKVHAVPSIREDRPGAVKIVDEQDTSAPYDLLTDYFGVSGVAYVPSFIGHTTDYKYFLSSDHKVYTFDYGQNAFVLIPELTNVMSLTREFNSSYGSAWLAIKQDGTVWSWGRNDVGQLGRTVGPDATNNFDPTPAKIPNLANIVSTGGPHTSIGIALDASGSVWTWGINDFGQAGTTTNNAPADPDNPDLPTYVPVPSQVTLPGAAIQVSSGNQYTMALLNNHTIQKWGVLKYDENGPTGPMNLTPVAETAINNVVDISSDRTADYYLKADGTVWVNGAHINMPVAEDLSQTYENSSVTPLKIIGLTDMTEIDASSNSLASRSTSDNLWLTRGATVTELTYTHGAGSFSNDGGIIGYIQPSGVALTAIQVNPSAVVINRGAAQQLTVTGIFSDNSTQDVTSQATYSSADPAVASVNVTGKITGVSVGQTVVSVTYNGFTSTTTTRVNPVAPQSPTNLALANGANAGKLNLTWHAPSDNGGSAITSYKVLRRTGTTSSYSQVASVSGTTLAYNDSGLTTGTTYYYEVVAVNSAGQSAPSAAVSKQAPGILGNPICVLGVCI